MWVYFWSLQPACAFLSIWMKCVWNSVTLTRMHKYCTSLNRFQCLALIHEAYKCFLRFLCWECFKVVKLKKEKLQEHFSVRYLDNCYMNNLQLLCKNNAIHVITDINKTNKVHVKLKYTNMETEAMAFMSLNGPGSASASFRFCVGGSISSFWWKNPPLRDLSPEGGKRGLWLPSIQDLSPVAPQINRHSSCRVQWSISACRAAVFIPDTYSSYGSHINCYYWDWAPVTAAVSPCRKRHIWQSRMLAEPCENQI